MGDPYKKNFGKYCNKADFEFKSSERYSDLNLGTKK